MRNKILKNYWCAIEDIFVGGNTNTVVFKTSGVNFFHFVSSSVIGQCDDRKDYRVETIKAIFRKAHEEIGDAGYMLPEWWVAGGQASGMNRGSIEKSAATLSRAITAISIASGDGIKL